jgi:hypothetical protein
MIPDRDSQKAPMGSPKELQEARIWYYNQIVNDYAVPRAEILMDMRIKQQHEKWLEEFEEMRSSIWFSMWGQFVGMIRDAIIWWRT